MNLGFAAAMRAAAMTNAYTSACGARCVMMLLWGLGAALIGLAYSMRETDVTRAALKESLGEYKQSLDGQLAQAIERNKLELARLQQVVDGLHAKYQAQLDTLRAGDRAELVKWQEARSREWEARRAALTAAHEARMRELTQLIAATRQAARDASDQFEREKREQLKGIERELSGWRGNLQTLSTDAALWTKFLEATRREFATLLERIDADLAVLEPTLATDARSRPTYAATVVVRGKIAAFLQASTEREQKLMAAVTSAVLLPSLPGPIGIVDGVERLVPDRRPAVEGEAASLSAISSDNLGDYEKAMKERTIDRMTEAANLGSMANLANAMSVQPIIDLFEQRRYWVIPLVAGVIAWGLALACGVERLIHRPPATPQPA